MDAATPSIWDGVVGQANAVRRLEASSAQPLHAYLFVGPPGSTKYEAARAFAGLLLSGTTDPTHRDNRLALAGQHPDVREFARVGAAISRDQADEIIRLAALAPNESSRKVLILDEFHLLTPEAAAKLLKTIEEPPASTVFIVLADHMPPDLVTIASRCIRIEFVAIDDETIISTLVDEGVARELATPAAYAASGDLTRARLLASDSHLALRRELFADTPRKLDGTGSAVVAATDALLAEIEAAAAPLLERQTAEVTAMEARVAALGERGSGKKSLEDRHKRELRRHRTDELRSGLATLAGSYRDALVRGEMARPDAAAAAISRIHAALEALERNPNETLLLQSLLLELRLCRTEADHMPTLSIDEVYAFLAEPNHLARFGTVDADGMPRVLPLWFIMDGDRLCFTPREPAMMWQNMLRDPHVGISIDEDEPPYRKVTLQGHVEVLYEPGRDRLWQHLYHTIAARYISVEAANAYVDNTDDQPRALSAIDLTADTTRLTTWRMPVSGEDPRGIWHARYYVPGTKMDPRQTS